MLNEINHQKCRLVYYLVNSQVEGCASFSAFYRFLDFLLSLQFRDAYSELYFFFNCRKIKCSRSLGNMQLSMGGNWKKMPASSKTGLFILVCAVLTWWWWNISRDFLETQMVTVFVEGIIILTLAKGIPFPWLASLGEEFVISSWVSVVSILLGSCTL